MLMLTVHHRTQASPPAKCLIRTHVGHSELKVSIHHAIMYIFIILLWSSTTYATIIDNIPDYNEPMHSMDNEQEVLHLYAKL